MSWKSHPHDVCQLTLTALPFALCVKDVMMNSLSLLTEMILCGTYVLVTFLLHTVLRCFYKQAVCTEPATLSFCWMFRLRKKLNVRVYGPDVMYGEQKGLATSGGAACLCVRRFLFSANGLAANNKTMMMTPSPWRRLFFFQVQHFNFVFSQMFPFFHFPLSPYPFLPAFPLPIAWCAFSSSSCSRAYYLPRNRPRTVHSRE